VQPDLPDLLCERNVTGRSTSRQRSRSSRCLRLYRNEQPVAGRVCSFGGEPTIHPISSHPGGARDLGFSHLQIASNASSCRIPPSPSGGGLRPAHHLPAVHGLDDHVYRDARARSARDQAEGRGIDPQRHAIVYVPTTAGGSTRTRSEDPAVRHRQHDVSSGISYQPVAITGRISHESGRSCGSRCRTSCARLARRRGTPARTMVPAEPRSADSKMLSR